MNLPRNPTRGVRIGSVTIGGGHIIEATPGRLRRSRTEAVAELRERSLAVAEDTTFVEYCLKTAPAIAAGEADLARRAKVMPDRLREILKEFAANGQALTLGAEVYVHRDRAEEVSSRILAALADFHRASPESPGMALDALIEAAALPKPVCEGLLARLSDARKVVERAGRIALAEHRAVVADKDREAVEKVEQLFSDRAFSPPDAAEAADVLRISVAAAEKAVRLLEEQQKLVKVAPDMLFHCDAIARAKQILSDFIRKEGKLESVKFKYLLDTSRRYAIPLLDYFDRVGVTRAVGHTRYLRPPKPRS